MIETPQLTRTLARCIAVLRLTVPRREIQNVMGPGLAELKREVARQGIAVVGPWFTHHLRMDPAVFDFEIGVPVAAPVSAASRVAPSVWPAESVAKTTFHGSYEGLAAAWGELEAWIAAQGRTSAPDLWECYAAGPESSPDPALWRTELTRPLRG